MSYDSETYLSPFTWRYGSPPMRQIWSEVHKRKLMRRVWIALATAQNNAGLVTKEQLADLVSHQDDVDVDRAREIEAVTRHDVVAEIRTYAEQCQVGGGIIHWGVTSADITDNVDILRMREAARLLTSRLEMLLTALADLIERTAELPVIAFTHIQPAEPTTLGYRLSMYGQDLLKDLTTFQSIEENIQGKGFKGAVGTQATFVEMLEGTSVSASELEADAMSVLNLPYYPIATQTYPRRQDFDLLSMLAGMAASLHKLALDFRIMQSPAIGEWAEPFGVKQTGSSAMPFKRNPIISENICSLARYISGLPVIAWENASQSILERSLDDSANRRIILPEAFLAAEECLIQAERIVSGMEIDEAAIARNLQRYGLVSATERLLTALVAAGADRQEAHEWLRSASISAKESFEYGGDNPLAKLVLSDERIGRYLDAGQIKDLLSTGAYTGTASERALSLVKRIRYRVGQSDGSSS
ncbi:MAG TPA: adenylosuccinate lyase [candidate division Zixibacteria bacterium]|nr:adenylosuccinate lyase [candidate division Zixibacteria bacterium]